MLIEAITLGLATTIGSEILLAYMPETLKDIKAKRIAKKEEVEEQPAEDNKVLSPMRLSDEEIAEIVNAANEKAANEIKLNMEKALAAKEKKAAPKKGRTTIPEEKRTIPKFSTVK